MRYGSESPSKYTALLEPMFPFTQSDALALHPSVLGEGVGSLAHWSRFADGFASVKVVVAEREPCVAVTRYCAMNVVGRVSLWTTFPERSGVASPWYCHVLPTLSL